MFTSAHECCRKLKIEAQHGTQLKPTDALPKNQDENISRHTAYTYNHYGGKKSLSHNLTAVPTDTHTCTHAHTHTVIIVITTTANLNNMTEQIF